MTIYYFIRHCEKEWDGTRNPHLTDGGRKRAEFWAQFFSDKGIEQVFCTPLIRTQETAAPLLKELGIDFDLYDPTNLYSNRFQQLTQGKTVLIVGHQDTTPTFVNRILKDRRYSYISNHDFGNLYQVTIEDDGNTKSTLHHLDFTPPN